MLEIVASIVGGSVLGGIISAWIARHYARKTAEERRAEFDVLFNYLQMYLEPEKEHPKMKIERDEENRPKTITMLYGGAAISGRGAMSAQGEIIHKPPEDSEEQDDARS